MIMSPRGGRWGRFPPQIATEGHREGCPYYEKVEIYETKSQYYVCPKCGGGHITRAVNRCIDCGVRIKWRKK